MLQEMRLMVECKFVKAIQVFSQKDRQTVAQTDGWMDGQIAEWTDDKIDRWKERDARSTEEINREMDRRTDKQIITRYLRRSTWKQNILKLPKKKTTDRQTYWWTGVEENRQNERQIHKRHKRTDRQTDGQTDRSKDEYTNGQIGKQNDREKEIKTKEQTERQTNR
jgi:hypothetical protein